MTKAIIVAIARNFAIGKNNDLLYHMPNDMRHFKETTTGHPVIMGRNTFYSFPRRPLPNRKNIVLALPDEVPADKEGALWVNSIDQALALCSPDDEVFFIGGAYVYRQTLPLVDKIYLTIVDDAPTDADAWFPTIDYDQWTILSRQDFPADERHAHPYSFLEMQRRTTHPEEDNNKVCGV